MTLTEQRFQADQAADPFATGPDVDVLFDRLMSSLRRLDDRQLIQRAGIFEQRLERERLVAAARVAGTSGDVSSNRKRTRALLGGSGRSRRSTNRDARRAAAIAANPSLATNMADGSIAADSIDALAKAAHADTGQIPDELIDQVAGLTPGQTDHAVERFLEDTADRDEVNDLHRRQMQARRCRRGFKPAGEGKPAMATVVLEGPNSTIDRIWNQICAAADAAYKANGGRDRPAGQHDRWEHRLFDAAVAFFDTATPDGPKPAAQAGPAAGTEPSTGPETSAGARPSTGSKPAVVVSIKLEDLGHKPATQHGSGPISDEVLANYVASSPIYTLLTDAAGRPLWLGRTRRHATLAQFLVLAVRDGGCVRCGAAVQRCEAHHVVPWNAPAEGHTDIDNLALLCGPCHRQLHQHSQTLYQQVGPNGRTIWHTRPATPNETPPPKQRAIQRE